MFDIASLFRVPAHQPETVYFRRNQHIFCQGAPSDSLFYIEKGTVKLTVTTSSGKQALVGVYDRGNLFGESSLISYEPVWFHNAIAVSNVRALRIDRAAARCRLHSDSTVAYALVTLLLNRNADILQELVEQLLVSGERRLARALCSIALVGATDQTSVAPKLTQQDLADRIGLTRQRVNVLMTRLKKSGVVDQDGRLKSRRAGAKSGGNKETHESGG